MLSNLTCQQRERDKYETQTKPRKMTIFIECVDGYDVEHDVTKIRGQRDHVEEDIADWQKFYTHFWNILLGIYFLKSKFPDFVHENV